MPSEPLLDFDTLVAPIAGDNPAGAPLPYDVKLKLEDLRKEVNPDDYDADDPRRPEGYRKPDWAAIVKLANDTLAKTSKDLLAAARLTEALTIEKGFPGLRDGIDLLARLADQAWDRIYPPIEEGETADVREGPYKWLNQVKYGALFPATVRATPFFRVAGTGYSYNDWQKKDERDKFETALAEVSAEAMQHLVDDLKAAKEKLGALTQTLNDKMGEAAPDFVSSENTENLGAAINDCLKAAQLFLQRKTGGPAVADQDDSSGAAGGSVVSRNLSNRSDAYRMLSQAADMLQQLEPHSPIPYFIRRCVKLGQLQFPDLMKALIRENAVLDELNRLMGMDAAGAPAGGA